MYQINPRYTKSYKVTDKHKLVLEQRCADGTDGRKYLTSMEYLALPKYKKANTRHISIENAVEYPELPTTFDPYLYGL